MSLDAAIRDVVIDAISQALAPYLRRLSDPEPLVYSVREAAHVLRTSTNTVRRLVDEGVLPIVPHMGHRIVIPRSSVAKLVEVWDSGDNGRAMVGPPMQMVVGS